MSLVIVCPDFQRQTGSQQVGSTIEVDRGGESPMGQASAIAAVQFLNGSLGGNQQQHVEFGDLIMMLKEGQFV